ncbi:MAG: DUF2326 domain-containing protein [Bacteroidales bacterium]|nr:DUF2326 domain-containing protein [Bacteroidales bacterium]
MFLKSLIISTPTKVIRELSFHKGLNLIVDETPSGETLTGNNVGKTTVLRLIDFCLGRDGSVVFKDPESKREVYQLVKDYLIDNKIIITLSLVDDIDNPQYVVEVNRNFLARKEAICRINGVDINKTDFEKRLGEVIFPSIIVEKPTFRQIIAHNVRYEDIRLNNTLDILNSFTKLEEYETLYLFLFGCDYDEGSRREELIANIKSESNYKKRLEKNGTKNSYKVALQDIDREIAKLEQKKSSFNINPHLDQDLDELAAVKEDLHRVNSSITSLRIRRDVIQESINDYYQQRFDVDMAQLQLVYKQAAALMPTIQHTFEEMVSYHNKMLANRARFIEEEIPELDEKIAQLQASFISLREKERYFTEKITASDTFEELEKVINALNEQYTRKGEYGAILSQIESVEEAMSKFYEDLKNIDDGLFSTDFKTKVDDQLSKFNDIFSEISDELYDERYSVKEDVVRNSKGQSVYKFSVIGTNLSSGKKQGEISCFDIAYTLFADQESIPCLHFILNDKKELMHDNQLVKLAEIANRENIQFVASILEDKLPVELRNKDYYVVKLSQNDKLLRIENQS